MAPTLVVGSPEYRAIYFPARDQCLASGGPQFMPNGYAAQPYFRPPAAPPPNPNQASCEQYGRLLTEFTAPTLVVGSPEYRAIYFPARDECLNRNGPQFMPNGYAAQPYFRPPAPPPPNPNQASCEQYGRELTAYMAPTLIVGSPEYRAIYFPARDECLNRNGPQFMPNGYASAPYFRPAQAGNPPTPPSAPPAPSTGPGNDQRERVREYVRTQIAPGTLQETVYTKIRNCQTIALTAAQRAGAFNTAPWTNAGKTTALTCLTQATNLVNAAAAMTIKLSAATGCRDLGGGWQVCPDPNGGICVMPLPGGDCTHVDETINVNGRYPTIRPPDWEPTWSDSGTFVNFFNCPGGSCLTGTVNETPSGGTPPPGPGGGTRDLLEVLFNACDNDPRGLVNCFVEECQKLNHSEEACRAKFKEYLISHKPPIPNTVRQKYKPEVDALFEVLSAGALAELFRNSGQALWNFMKGVGAGIGTSAEALSGVFVVVPAELLQKYAGGNTAAVVRGQATISDPRQLCNSYVAANNPLVGAPLPPSDRQILADFALQICLDNKPTLATIQAWLAQRFGSCASKSVKDIREWSSAVASCLTGAALREPGLNSIQRQNYANTWITLLSRCSQNMGLQWTGGMAVPVPGGPVVTPPQYVMGIRGCFDETLRAIIY